MAHWTIEAPTSLNFDGVTDLRVRLIGGSVAVLATEGTPSLDVASVTGDPLEVTYEDGVLTVSHENLTWEGLLKWLRPQRHSAEADAQVHLHSISGDVRSEFAELTQLSAPASHSVSGSLGAGSGSVSVTTMSGRVMLLRRAGRGNAPADPRTGREPDNENEMEGEAS
jgi:hypothetical protein